MRYWNRFKSHMEQPDPRSNVFGAGGCNWPTVPAARYLLTSDNPVGAFDFLATVGCLMHFFPISMTHDLGIWTGPFNVCPVNFAALNKRILPGNESWEWGLIISLPLCPEPIINWWGPYSGPCNTDAALGTIQCANPSVGDSGDDLQIRQVEWDGVWPPYYSP